MRSDSLSPRSIDQIEIETRRLSEGSVISAGGRENGLRIFLELRPDLSPLFGFTWDDGACDNASSLNGTRAKGAWADLPGTGSAAAICSSDPCPSVASGLARLEPCLFCGAA